jgi:hypothetical protein
MSEIDERSKRDKLWDDELVVRPDERVSTQLIPDTPMMKKQTYASPMSYVGSARRIKAWTHGWSLSFPLAPVVAWGVLVIGISMAWMFITGWYLFTLVFFWWFVFPFRFFRRSQRKQEALQRTQLATMQAMMIQQQQALGENKTKP